MNVSIDQFPVRRARSAAREGCRRAYARLWPRPVAPRARIQIVDADVAVRMRVAAYMRGAGLEVREADDSEGALACMRRTTPDVLVLDPVLPAGRALVVACRGDPLLSAVPLILLSAEPDLSRTATELGARAGLVKPIDMDILLAILRQVARC